MFSSQERDDYFDRTVTMIQSVAAVEGIVQLGSGVTGYKDAYSDIDLMVCIAKEIETHTAKEQIYQALLTYRPQYIKEKKFGEAIFLLIVLLENGLEFNISIAPRDLLPVRSPLWKVVADKTGNVLKKMTNENEKFENNAVKYDTYSDIGFEFFYCAIGLEKELRRNNLIYSLKLLGTLQDYVLHIQAMNEQKKCHQFKAYETLNTDFTDRYLAAFPAELTIEAITLSLQQIVILFLEVMEDSAIYESTDRLRNLLLQRI